MSEDIKKELVSIYESFNSVDGGLHAFGYSTWGCKACHQGKCMIHDGDKPIDDEVSSIYDAAHEAFISLEKLMIKHACLPEWANVLAGQEEVS